MKNITKSIQIDVRIHKQLKEYCEKKGLKLGQFVSSTIKKKLKNENK